MRFPMGGIAMLLLLPSRFIVTQSPPARWTVDSRPVVTIGESEADTSSLLTAVVGATRLPDGRILVGDNASFSLRLFSATGAPLRAFGRKGSGPGEVNHLQRLFRCGDSLLTIDTDAYRTSVFSLDGAYVRSFRFGTQRGYPPYDSACNRNGVFAHVGWEIAKDMKPGAYRPMVPIWLSRADSAVQRVIGTLPGPERLGMMAGERVSGSAPLPLGKPAAIALSVDRLYIGDGDRYEILAFDLSGQQVGTIRKANAVVATTREAVDYAKERDIATMGERFRPSIEKFYADAPIPKTLPAYVALRVDALGYLWVQDYPRRRSPTVTWSIFDSRGRQVAEAALPVHLEVYEIGDDYVLGRFLDPDESIPQVRLYRLQRARPTR